MYDLTIDKALTLLINKEASVIEKWDTGRYKLKQDVLVSVRDYVPAIIDITDKWRVVR